MVSAFGFGSFGQSGSRPMPEDPGYVRNDLPKHRRFPLGLSGRTNPRLKKRKKHQYTDLYNLCLVYDYEYPTFTCLDAGWG